MVDRKTIKDLFKDDPEILRVLEAREQTGLLRSIAQNGAGQPTIKATKIEFLKGDDGITPTKGVDYFTPEEIESIKEDVRPIKGVHYSDGEKGEPGPQGEPGNNADESKIIAKLKKLIPSSQEIASHIKVPKGNGIDEEGLVKRVISKLPKQEPIKFDEIFDEFIQKIKKEKSFDISHIRNASSFMKDGIKYKIEELMHGGSGGGSSSGTSVFNEVVSGSGTTFTLAHTPISGTQAIYALGQRLTLTVDYTISGAVITTVSSWLAGQILADYKY